MLIRPLALSLVLALAVAPSARANETNGASNTGDTVNRASSAYPLEYRPVLDWSILGGGALLWGLSEMALKAELAPSTCKWCERDAEGISQVNAFDRTGRHVRWSLENQHTAARLSDVGAFGVIPVSVLGFDAFMAHRAGDIRTAKLDAFIVVQSVLVSAVLNQSVKFFVGRERPFVHALPDPDRALTQEPEDNNLSFYSGHTTYAFAFVVSTGVVATLRNYPHRWAIWSFGLPLAGSIGYLRMAADKHYLSDVLVGALAGSAVGVAVPLLLHPRLEEGSFSNVSVNPSFGGFTVSGVF